MSYIEELKWRGMLYNTTPEVETYLKGGQRRGYIGFDPTAPSLTIGNYVQLMILTFFQKCGHQPITLMGGATGRIGDPSGKDAERQLKSLDEIHRNVEAQTKQLNKFMNFEDGPNKAIFVDNFSFYENMNILEFLRSVGKTLTVNYMLSKESVKNRMESGISFTEFSYQLLQAYDFQCLYEQYDCKIQMGGSDQWGNITSGTEFIRRNSGGKAYAVTTPLLTKTDGTKFGKSESGNIWLDPEMTTPYAFYQFWINCDDRDLPKFFRYFSFKNQEEIESLESDEQMSPQQLKKILAEELTSRVHSKEAFDSVLKVTELLFGRRANKETIGSFNASEWKMVEAEIPSFKLDKSLLAGGVNIIDLLTDYTGSLASKGDARRAVKGNALSLNKEKVTSMDAVVSSQDILNEGFILLENGKKNKFLLVID